MFRDYYEILGADPYSTRDEIKRLYRMRAREAHPDRHPDNAASQTAEMSLINEAYNILSDSRKRSAYDIEWKRHYRMKGLARDKAPDVPPGNNHHEISRPSSVPRTGKLPFWKDHRILVGILLILLLILAVDIYVVYFKGRLRDRTLFRRPPIEQVESDRYPAGGGRFHFR